MKNETESGYGPKCEAKRKGKVMRRAVAGIHGNPAFSIENVARAVRKALAGRDPRQIEFAFQEVA